MDAPLTCPCQFCEVQTTNTGTKMCDNCWEVESRLSQMPIKVIQRILKSMKLNVTMKG